MQQQQHRRQFFFGHVCFRSRKWAPILEVENRRRFLTPCVFSLRDAKGSADRPIIYVISHIANITDNIANITDNVANTTDNVQNSGEQKTF